MAAHRVAVGIMNHNGERYLMPRLQAAAHRGPIVDDVRARFGDRRWFDGRLFFYAGGRER